MLEDKKHGERIPQVGVTPTLFLFECPRCQHTTVAAEIQIVWKKPFEHDADERPGFFLPLRMVTICLVCGGKFVKGKPELELVD